ncbi:RNA polymerase sigma factor [Mariniblastus fucicola]|uniref:ECF RNA polymerase sigma factor SigE n=1 Tax=Mariniblastus fucicola TaxID=980251 RepID=A0A5B9PB20_9BACT|nr:RNA polymerase sigma factor [Mariniblastus fucicola]QEG22122.1 ECF RNA polymerase sigma factor SigE [Mariniblastus fucicola]
MSMPFESAMSDAKEFVSETAEPNPETETGESCAIDARFFDQYAHQATRYAMSLVQCWADAEEVTQEAFCKLIQKRTIAAVSSESAAKAILFTTVRNLSVDQLRKHGRRKFEPFDEHVIKQSDGGLSDSGLEKLESGINQAILDLPDEWADSLQLKVNGGLSYEEIAEVLSATKNQVRIWIFRARKQLQAELKKSGLLETQ